jgi:hypothetical protein
MEEGPGEEMGRLVKNGPYVLRTGNPSVLRGKPALRFEAKVIPQRSNECSAAYQGPP